MLVTGSFIVARTRHENIQDMCDREGGSDSGIVIYEVQSVFSHKFTQKS